MTDQTDPRTIYISGPMRGYPEFNYPAFNDAAKRLRDLGYIVLNPAENFGGVDNLDREIYMKHDFFHVLQSDAIMALHGWQESEGARAEILVAQQIGIPIYSYTNGTAEHGLLYPLVETVRTTI